MPTLLCAAATGVIPGITAIYGQRHSATTLSVSCTARRVRVPGITACYGQWYSVPLSVRVLQAGRARKTLAPGTRPTPAETVGL